jgi:hypothetical protein
MGANPCQMEWVTSSDLVTHSVSSYGGCWVVVDGEVKSGCVADHSLWTTKYSQNNRKYYSKGRNCPKSPPIAKGNLHRAISELGI